MAADLRARRGVDAGQMIGGGIADAVAAGLDRMHLDLGEFGQNIRHLLELGPVELEVLARGEMPVAAVVARERSAERAQLRPKTASPYGIATRSIGAWRWMYSPLRRRRCAKFVVGHLPGEKAARLVAELRDPLADQRAIDGVITIHGKILSARQAADAKPPITGGHGLIPKRRTKPERAIRSHLSIRSRHGAMDQNVIGSAEQIRGCVQHSAVNIRFHEWEKISG